MDRSKYWVLRVLIIFCMVLAVLGASSCATSREYFSVQTDQDVPFFYHSIASEGVVLYNPLRKSEYPTDISLSGSFQTLETRYGATSAPYTYNKISEQWSGFIACGTQQYEPEITANLPIPSSRIILSAPV